MEIGILSIFRILSIKYLPLYLLSITSGFQFGYDRKGRPVRRPHPEQEIET